MTSPEPDVLADSLVVRTQRFQAIADWGHAQRVVQYLITLGCKPWAQIAGEYVHVYLIQQPKGGIEPPHDGGH